jgi:hypothetical protein
MNLLPALLVVISEEAGVKVKAGFPGASSADVCQILADA